MQIKPKYPNKKPSKKKPSQSQKLSRALAAVLRHKAIQVGLQMDTAGFVKLDELLPYLKGKGFHDVDEDAIRNIVDNNDKKRFQLQQRDNQLSIRAAQGHSIPQISTQQLLTKITDPTTHLHVIHGTYLKYWGLIQTQGLKRMSRNHIHFAIGMPKDEGVISGMRQSSEVYIEIDLSAAMEDGIDFYISSNNVILSEGINGVLPPKYFKNVSSRSGQNFLKKEQKEQQQQSSS